MEVQEALYLNQWNNANLFAFLCRLFLQKLIIKQIDYISTHKELNLILIIRRG